MRPLIFRAPPPAAWRAGGPVLVVAPHPDDECIGAGGAILHHLAAGDEVTVVVVTDGRGSRAGGRGPDWMAETRRAEFDRAVRRLGVEGIWLGGREGAWDAAAIGEALRAHVRRAAILYAPSPVDYHPDHLRVAALVAALVATPQRIRGMELGVPLTPLLANCFLRCGAQAGHRTQALALYVSQQGAIRTVERARAYRRPLYGSADGEPFWEMGAAAYRAVMAMGPRDDRESPFRDFRPRPLSDLLSFLAGWRTRRALRAAAQRAEEGSNV